MLNTQRLLLLAWDNLGVGIIVVITTRDNHYYDEDDIKVNKISANVKTSVSTPVAKPIKLTEEDKKKAREAAIKRLTEEQYALLRKKSSRAKKEVPEDQQMSLF